MPVVQMPDGTKVQFPDDMPREQIRSMIDRKYPGAAKPKAESPNYLVGMADMVGSGLAFGLDDEFAGAKAAISQPWRYINHPWMRPYNQSFRERYEEGRDEVRARKGEFRQSHPVSATVGEVAGAFAMPFGAAKSGATLLKGGMSAPKALGLGAVEGSIYGGLHGAGNADGRSLPKATTEGAVLGAAMGGSMSGLSQAFINKLANRAAPNAFRSIDDLKEAKGKAYKRVDDMGVEYTPEAVDDLLAGMKAQNEAEMIDPLLHQHASRVYDRVSGNIGGQPTSLSKMDQMRQFTRNNTQVDPQNQRFGRMMVQQIDDFVDSAGADKVLAGDAPAAASALKEARQLHGQASKYEGVQQAIDFAKQRAASTNSGGNTSNAIRQNVRRLWQDGQTRGKGLGRYSDAELKAMQRVVEGTPTQNAMRTTAKTLGGGIGKLTGIAGTASGQNPVYAALPFVGSMARGVDEAMTASNANALLKEILQGGPPQQSPQPAQLQALQKLLLERIVAGPEPVPAR